jgi:hypothetical protein
MAEGNNNGSRLPAELPPVLQEQEDLLSVNLMRLEMEEATEEAYVPALINLLQTRQEFRRRGVLDLNEAHDARLSINRFYLAANPSPEAYQQVANESHSWRLEYNAYFDVDERLRRLRLELLDMLTLANEESSRALAAVQIDPLEQFSPGK